MPRLRRQPTPQDAFNSGLGSRAPAAAALPADVRLMNSAARVLLGVVLLGAAWAGWRWLQHAPLLPIHHVVLQGEVTRHSAEEVREHAAPLLAGHFLGLDLQRSRQAFEALPWVRRAVVRRVWPDTLVVELQEHQPAAVWEGPADTPSSAPAERLVNVQGEVFEADLGEVEEDGLPRLAGPEGSAAQMLTLARSLQQALAPSGLALARLQQSQRGAWQLELDGGGRLTLGRGSHAELLARSERFARTYAELRERYPQPLEYADLRHADGYALRLRGVSTAAEAPARAGARAPVRTPARPQAAAAARRN